MIRGDNPLDTCKRLVMRLDSCLAEEPAVLAGVCAGMSSASVDFKGKISSVARDGRSGVVALDNSFDGKKFAVITLDTQGRLSLLNGVGKLEPGTPVKGRAEIGAEALRALTIQAER